MPYTNRLCCPQMELTMLTKIGAPTTSGDAITTRKLAQDDSGVQQQHKPPPPPSAKRNDNSVLQHLPPVADDAVPTTTNGCHTTSTPSSAQFVVDFFADPEQLARMLRPLLTHTVPCRELGAAIATTFRQQLERFQYSPLQNVIVELLASELMWVRRRQFVASSPPDTVQAASTSSKHNNLAARAAAGSTGESGGGGDKTAAVVAEQFPPLIFTRPANSVAATTSNATLVQPRAEPDQAEVSSATTATTTTTKTPPSDAAGTGGGKKLKTKIQQQQQPAAASVTSDAVSARRSTHDASNYRRDADSLLSSSPYKVLVVILKAIKFLAEYRANRRLFTPTNSAPLSEQNAELVKAFIEQNFLSLCSFTTNVTATTSGEPAASSMNVLLLHHLIEHLFRKYLYHLRLYDYLWTDRFPVVCDQRELYIRTVSDRSSSSWILPLCEAIPVRVLHAIAHLDGALTTTPTTALGEATAVASKPTTNQPAVDSGQDDDAAARQLDVEGEVKLNDEFKIKLGTLRKLVSSALCEALSTFQVNLRMSLRRREERYIAAAKRHSDEQQAKVFAKPITADGESAPKMGRKS